MKTVVLIFLSASFAQAAATNQILGFDYSSCAGDACVLVRAPKAYIGISQENFTTSGPTDFTLTERGGSKEKFKMRGSSVTFNPGLQTLVVEAEGGGFVLYSMKDGSLSDFRNKDSK